MVSANKNSHSHPLHCALHEIWETNFLASIFDGIYHLQAAGNTHIKTSISSYEPTSICQTIAHVGNTIFFIYFHH